MRKQLLPSLVLVLSYQSTTARLLPPPQFSVPKSDAFDHINPLIGNGGNTPGTSGGMIPSTGPPFAMTRWVAQTHQNYVSKRPYNWTADTIHGFQGTRQPAIWMGESGQVVVVPGVASGDGGVKATFEERGLKFSKDNEILTGSYYSVILDDGTGGEILAEESSTSRVGHLRFTFTPHANATPYVLIEATRPTVITSTPTNITFPTGSISIDPSHAQALEICGSNSERQDQIITPISTKPSASGFRGYFCARFDVPASSHGVIQNSTHLPQGALSAEGILLSAYAKFPTGTKVVNVRVGTSFISVDQARRNLDAEIPDGTSLEATAEKTRGEWVEKLGRMQIVGASEEQEEIWWTSVFHSLQYPSEQHEQGQYYSGYDDQVHEAEGSYTGYSIWDTFRAEWAWLILFAPERLPGMVSSMLADYKEGGWLPMWKNIVETNIMVGTHADSLVGEAAVKGVQGFDRELAWEAVWKDASVPPDMDADVVYSDRQENVEFEARAGLSTVYNVEGKGWVADDVHSESGSRTLDYAYDDYAVYQLARILNKPSNITSFLLTRALTAPFTLFNNETGFMEARNADGSWAGDTRGWTEGDKWIYTFDVVQDIPGLIERRGGNASFVQSLDDHFNGGHNNHANEPSHHIPYLYALAGAAQKTQEKVREIAQANYDNTPTGLSGNEDCGQMSAWYIFSALGFYPVNPASGEYVIGSPFFEKITIALPDVPGMENDRPRVLTITALGAPEKQYVKSLTINGVKVDTPIVRHEQISKGGEFVFEMSDEAQSWGSAGV